MARYATRGATTAMMPAKAGPMSLGPSATRARTAEGGAGWIGDARTELFTATVSGHMADGFYESEEGRRQRVAELVKVIVNESDDGVAWLEGLVRWLRHTVGIRTAPLVIALEAAAAGAPARPVVRAALRRADELGEALAYWKQFHGHVIPNRVKRAIADAAVGLYTERSTARYDAANRAWNFGDVLEVVHPRPGGEHQALLFKHLLDRRRHSDEPVPGDLRQLAHLRRFMDATPAQRAQWRDAALTPGYAGNIGDLMSAIPSALSWEMLAAETPGGLDARWWDALILAGNVQGLAVLRNLANIDKAGAAMNGTVKARVEDELRSPGLTLPYRYLSAYDMAADRWKLALAQGADAALANMPAFPGATLVMVDVSGSMTAPVGTGKSRRPLSRARVAGFLAEAVARRCEESLIVTYNMGPVQALQPEPARSLLEAATRREYRGSGGTATWSSLEAVWRQLSPVNGTPDRVLIITDEQARDRDSGMVTCPVITWNIAGETGVSHANHGARNRFLVAGYTDAALAAMPGVLAARSTGVWPWESAS